MATPQQASCPASLPEGFFSEGLLLGDPLSEKSLIENSQKIIETVQKDKDFHSFLTESAQKQEAVLESQEFQDIVRTLRVSTLQDQPQLKNSHSKSSPAELTLFMSFSLGEPALLNLAREAKIYGATLVLRGFKDTSYAQTVKALQKIIQETGMGFIIDPELFSLFAVTAVPTIILSRPFHIHAVESKTLESKTLERIQTPIHDRIQGHVSLHYALEMFAKEGDLQNEARSLLKQVRKGGFQ